MQNAVCNMSRDPRPATRDSASGSTAMKATVGEAVCLNAVRALLDALDQQQIRYCHWKSNDCLAKSVAGGNDLDLLIDRGQYGEVQAILATYGFKRRMTGFDTRTPTREHYLTLDEETGRWVHVDLHYGLMLGRPKSRDFRVPWGKRVLETRIFDDHFGLYRSDPNLELVLLLVRAAVKLRWRDVVLDALGRRYFRGNWVEQFEWLGAQTDPQQCAAYCHELLGADAARLLKQLLQHPAKLSTLWGFRRLVVRQLRLCRTQGRGLGTLLMWWKECFTLAAYVNRRRLDHRFPLHRKLLSTGGLFVSFIGPDGSGKSTLSQAAGRSFAPMVETVRVYLGAGDGRISILRRPLRMAARLVRRRKAIPPRPTAVAGNGASRSEASPPRARSGFLWSLGRACWAISLAVEKRARLQAAWKARNRGLLVITDRYPQTQIAGFNDGPLLGDWLHGRNRLLRALARWEGVPYEWADATPPEVVIRLNVELGTACQRQPGDDAGYLQRRIEAVQSLRFPASSVVDLDANRPLEDVLLDVKNIIWKHL